jgi:hypothetical protein
MNENPFPEWKRPYGGIQPEGNHYSPHRVHDFSANGLNVVRKGETCDAWIIFLQSQPYDDDVYVVYWDENARQWFWKAAGYCPFGEAYAKLDEQTGVILLEYFGLLDRWIEYPPQRLQETPPELLRVAGQ